MLLVIKAPTVDLAVSEIGAAETARSEVAQLTAAMRRADESAYAEFFRLYFHRLLSYLLVITRGDEQAAHDLVQQTMIKVAKHIRVFRDEAALWRWLALIARTSAVDHGRKSQRYFGFLRRFWEFRAEPPPTIPDHELDFSASLQVALGQLEPDDRILLEKKYLEGEAMKTIAFQLNVSEKAVESRLTRARAKLKQLLLEKLRHE